MKEAARHKVGILQLHNKKQEKFKDLLLTTEPLVRVITTNPETIEITTAIIQITFLKI